MRVVLEVITKGLKEAVEGLKKLEARLKEAGRKGVKNLGKIKGSIPSLSDAVKNLKTNFDLLKQGITQLGRDPVAAINTLKTALWGLATNPIMMLIAAITGLVVAAGKLITSAVRIGESHRLALYYIRQAGGGIKEYTALLKTAAQTGAEIGDLAQLFQMVSGSLTTDKALQFTDALARTSAWLGLTNEQVKGLSIAFGQAFAIGTLKAQELNQIINQSPVLAVKIAEAMGMSMAQFRQAVNEGRVSAEELANALIKIGEQADISPKTIGQAWAKLKNSIALALGEFGRALNLGPRITRMLDTIANGVRALIPAFRRIGSAIDSVIRFVQGAIRLFAELGRWTSEVFTDFTIYKPITDKFAKAFGWLADKVKQALDKIKQLVSNIPRWFANIIAAYYTLLAKIQEGYLRFLIFVREQVDKVNKLLPDKLLQIDTSGLDASIDRARQKLEGLEAVIRRIKEEGLAAYMQPVDVGEPVMTKSAASQIQNTETLQQNTASAVKVSSSILTDDLKALYEQYSILNQIKATHDLINKLKEAGRLTDEQTTAYMNSLNSLAQKHLGLTLEEAMILYQKLQAHVQENDIISEKLSRYNLIVSKYRELIEAQKIGLINSAQFVERLKKLQEETRKLGLEWEQVANAIQDSARKVDELGVRLAGVLAQAGASALEGGQSAEDIAANLGSGLVMTLLSTLGGPLGQALSPLMGVLARKMVHFWFGLFKRDEEAAQEAVQQQAEEQAPTITVNIVIERAEVDDEDLWRWLVREKVLPAINELGETPTGTGG